MNTKAFDHRLNHHPIEKLDLWFELSGAITSNLESFSASQIVSLAAVWQRIKRTEAQL